MYTFKLDGNDDLEIDENENGLITLKVATRTESIVQLVRLRLLTVARGKRYEPEDAIPWFTILENRRLVSLLGTLVGSLVLSTEGVASIDLSNAEVELDPPSLTNICFTTTCGETVETDV